MVEITLIKIEKIGNRNNIKPVFAEKQAIIKIK